MDVLGGNVKQVEAEAIASLPAGEAAFVQRDGTCGERALVELVRVRVKRRVQIVVDLPIIDLEAAAGDQPGVRGSTCAELQDIAYRLLPYVRVVIEAFNPGRIAAENLSPVG